MRAVVLALLLSLAIGSPVCAFSQDGNFDIMTSPSQSAALGQQVVLPLKVKGGSGPYFWQMMGGQLPPGLKLDANAGSIAGTAKAAGEYHFTLWVQDSSAPPLQTRRDFTFVVTAPSAALTIEWQKAPKVTDQTIAGSVVVSNHSENPFDLTVIVLAVNEIDRATALGYQHFTLAPQGSQTIPFGSAPGAGNYIVHADAVAEVASNNSIYRARKQTASPLHVPH